MVIYDHEFAGDPFYIAVKAALKMLLD